MQLTAKATAYPATLFCRFFRNLRRTRRVLVAKAADAPLVSGEVTVTGRNHRDGSEI